MLELESKANDQLRVIEMSFPADYVMGLSPRHTSCDLALMICLRGVGIVSTDETIRRAPQSSPCPHPRNRGVRNAA